MQCEGDSSERDERLACRLQMGKHTRFEEVLIERPYYTDHEAVCLKHDLVYGFVTQINETHLVPCMQRLSAYEDSKLEACCSEMIDPGRSLGWPSSAPDPVSRPSPECYRALDNGQATETGEREDFYGLQRVCRSEPFNRSKHHHLAKGMLSTPHFFLIVERTLLGPPSRRSDKVTDGNKRRHCSENRRLARAIDGGGVSGLSH